MYPYSSTRYGNLTEGAIYVYNNPFFSGWAGNPSARDASKLNGEWRLSGIVSVKLLFSPMHLR